MPLSFPEPASAVSAGTFRSYKIMKQVYRDIFYELIKVDTSAWLCNSLIVDITSVDEIHTSREVLTSK